MNDDLAAKPAADHRHETRTPTVVRPGFGLSLRLPSRRRIPVAGLRNVSASGTAIELQRSVRPGSEVALIVVTEGLQLEFAAVVAWCRRAPSAGPTGSAAGHTHLAGLSLKGQGSFAAMLAATTVLST